MKEIIFRVDDSIATRLEQEVKKRRSEGKSTTMSDAVLIRLIEGINQNSKVIVLRLQDNKLIIRNYRTLKYDDDRQIG